MTALLKPDAPPAPALIPLGFGGGWWQLKSGRLVQICRLWYCEESSRVMATVRYIEDDEGRLAVNAFDMALQNITRFARLIAR